MKRGARLLLLLIAAWVIFEFWTVSGNRPSTTPRPLPSRYKKGVYHVHSLHSDGRGDPGQIAAAAARAGAQFVILTDHGRPNEQSVAATAWLGETLLVGGSELAVSEGHLAACGFAYPGWNFASEGAQARLDVERLGGITFVAHPFDRAIPWRSEDASGATGIEVISAYQQVRQVPWYRLFRLPLQYLLSPAGATLGLLRSPDRELAWWDRLLETQQLFAIYALDAHGPLRGLGFPSYQAMFSLLTVYVQSPGPLDPDAGIAAAGLVGALRAGRFFSAIEALAPAAGFDVWIEEKDGARVESGAVLPAGTRGELVWEIPADFPVEIRTIRNGRPWKTITTRGAGRHSCSIDGDGVYRSEIHPAAGPFRDLPWILTNPIRIGPLPKPSPPPPAPLPSQVTPLSLAGETLEKNGASTATRTFLPTGSLAVDLTVRRGPPERDAWVALAWHRRVNWGKYRALRVRARTSRSTRLAIQVGCDSANAGGRYQRSVFCSTEIGEETIPFAELRSLPGTTAPFDSTRVTSLYILADPDLLGNLAPLRLELDGIDLLEAAP